MAEEGELTPSPEEEEPFLAGFQTLQDYSQVRALPIDREWEHETNVLSPYLLVQCDNVASLLQALVSQVVKTTRASNQLPGEGDDFEYYSSFPGFKTFCDKMSGRVNRM